MSRYAKPYLTYEQQLDLLESRGLDVEPRRRSREVLRAIGYYRLSGYLHPFRLREGARPLDRFPAGLSLATVADVWRFDQGLRALVLEGVEIVEVGLRSQVAYQVGRRSPFAHLDPGQLNPAACARRGSPRGPTAHAQWCARLGQLERASRGEDFVAHFADRYDGGLPVWAVVEVLDFGALSRLFLLLRGDDQNAIARELELVAGSDLGRWVQALNVVRNMAAHHRRLWNRTLTYAFPATPAARLPRALVHLADGVPRRRMYYALAVMAHLARAIDPATDWPERVAAHCHRFPRASGLSPERHMGFPDGWPELDLWARSAASGRG